MYIIDNQTNELIDVEIVGATYKTLPLKKNGWKFNWRKAYKDENSSIFILRIKLNPASIQGALQLVVQEGMLIMNLVEIAPQNIGSTLKRYDFVAGCLIAFSCRESFKLENNYKGFLTFESKTRLIELYKNKYFAQQAMGQKMFIEPADGRKLIDTYINRNKNI